VILPFLGFAASVAAFAQSAIPTLDVQHACGNVNNTTVCLDSEFNWTGYWTRVAPIIAQKIGFPKNVPTIHIALNPDSSAHYWINNETYGNDTVIAPQEVLGYTVSAQYGDFGVPYAIIREITHLSQNGGCGNYAICEGVATAGMQDVYNELTQEGYNVIAPSGISSMRTAGNLPRDCKVGNADYASQDDSSTVGAWMNAMSGGNLAPLVSAIYDLGNRIKSQQIIAGEQTTLDVLDQTLPRFEGKSASTVYRGILSTFVYGAPVVGFCAEPAAFISPTITDRAPIIRNGDPVKWTIRTNNTNGTTYNYTAPASMQVMNEAGQVVMSQFGAQGWTFFPTSAPANGAYVVRAMACPTAAPCTTATALYTHTMPWFAINDDPNWSNDHFVAICNGNGAPGSFATIGKLTCRLVNPPPGVTSQTYGTSLLYVSLHGFRGSLAVTDGTSTYVYAATTDQTQVAYWTLLDQPYLYSFTDGANWEPLVGVPGSWTTAWPYFGSHDDPTAATSTPLPTTIQGAGVKITDINGVVRDAPVIFTSQLQGNFQLPWETAIGPIGVQVTLNGALSNMVIGRAVTADPAVFAEGVNGGAAIGAVTFAVEADPRYGQLVTPTNPVSKTDWISIWLNGLGGMNPEPVDANVTPRATVATNPASVSIGSAPCNTEYSGLAPAFVALGQININLATCMGLPSGSLPLVVTVAGIPSQPVELAVR
jgi:uncharacterized protein (TIGR03437 family)